METTSDNQAKQNLKKKSSKKQAHVDTDDSSNVSEMMKSIASVLQEIVNESEAEASSNRSGQPSSKDEKSSASFWAKKPPSISILGYFERIVKYSLIEDSTIIISLIFIDRLCEISNIQLNKHNIHR